MSVRPRSIPRTTDACLTSGGSLAPACTEIIQVFLHNEINCFTADALSLARKFRIDDLSERKVVRK